MNFRNVMRFESPAEMSVAALSTLAGYAQTVIRARGRINILLSGGSSPLGMYSLISRGGNTDILPWSKVHLYWGDERFVPRNHPDNNFGTAWDIFISKLDIPRENIHNVNTALATPAETAAAYCEELQKISGDPIPVFDLVLLGVGKDGHMASLFPNSTALVENERAVIDTPAPTSSSPHVPRITVTFPVLEKARKIFVISAGAEKLPVIDYVLSEFATEIKYPIQMIDNSNISWFISNQ